MNNAAAISPFRQQSTAAAQLFRQKARLDQRRLPRMRPEGRRVSTDDSVRPSVKFTASCKTEKKVVWVSVLREALSLPLVSLKTKSSTFVNYAVVRISIWWKFSGSCFVHSSGALTFCFKLFLYPDTSRSWILRRNRAIGSRWSTAA